MKVLVILAISTLAYAKPKLNPTIRFADSKIIGGSEAPKRNFSKTIISQFTTFKHIFEYNRSTIEFFISNFR